MYVKRRGTRHGILKQDDGAIGTGTQTGMDAIGKGAIGNAMDAIETEV